MAFGILQYIDSDYKLEKNLSPFSLGMLALGAANSISYYWTMVYLLMYRTIPIETWRPTEDSGYILTTKSGCTFADIPVVSSNAGIQGSFMVNGTTPCLFNSTQWVGVILDGDPAGVRSGMPSAIWIMGAAFLSIAVPLLNLATEEYAQHLEEDYAPKWKKLLFNGYSRIFMLFIIQMPIDCFKGQASDRYPGFRSIAGAMGYDLGLYMPMFVALGMLLIVGILQACKKWSYACSTDAGSTNKTQLAILPFMMLVCFIGFDLGSNLNISFKLPDLSLEGAVKFFMGDITKLINFTFGGLLAIYHTAITCCTKCQDFDSSRISSIYSA